MRNYRDNILKGENEKNIISSIKLDMDCLNLPKEHFMFVLKNYWEISAKPKNCK